MEPLLIIGAGMAGWTTVREIRKLHPTVPVVLITADSGDFYAKPTLSNAFAQKRSPAQLVGTPAATLAASQNITLMARTRLDALDVAAKTVHVSHSGQAQTLRYSSLVLATGAQAIRVPMQGSAAQEVLSINSLDDFSEFYARISPGQRSESNPTQAGKTVLIMGAGLIGCEFANDLHQAGHTVHVVDPSARPLAALLPEGAGLQLQQALAALGVVWHLGVALQTLDHGPHGGLAARLTNGETIGVDTVLSAIGLRADTALASASGIVCERGIVVNEWLQTSAAHVYALGDCAQYVSAANRTLPYVMPIMSAARALAATLCGSPVALVFPLMPVSIKTPALPTVIAPPIAGQDGAWVADPGEPGIWRFLAPDGTQRGFALTGKQTARRMELSKAMGP